MNYSGDRDPSFCTLGSDCGDIPPVPRGPVLHPVLLHTPLPRGEVFSSTALRAFQLPGAYCLPPGDSPRGESLSAPHSHRLG